MATTIKLKNGSGAPLAGNLVQGEPALDLTNKRLYTEDSGGTVIEVGTNPTSLTTGTFTSTGIDDNATSTAITIDSSENVGIGSASNHAGARVVINDTPPTAFGSPMFQVGQETFTASGYYSIGLGFTNGTYTEPPAEIAAVSTSSSGGTTADIILGTRNVTTNTAVTERMRIDSSGNVGIGTASPGSLNAAGLPLVVGSGSGNTGMTVFSGSGSAGSLHFADGSTGDASYRGYINYVHSGDSMQFGTAGLEAMRIDSSGNLLVGVTSASAKLHIDHSSASTPTALFLNQSTASSGVGAVETSIPSQSNNTNCYHFKGTTQGVASYFLYGDGTSSFTSDERQKKNVVNTRNGYLDDLKRLRVVDYHWNNQEDTEDKSIGLIAQEVEQVFPHLVIEHEMEGVGLRKNLRGSEFTFVLIKAIQEQQAMIEQLKAEVAALKGE